MSSASLLQRLRERKVVQWAVAYLAGAWVVYEGTGTALEAWNIPVVLVRSIHVVLVIGFFVALVLAWYHGEKGRQRVSGLELVMVAALLLVAGLAISRLGAPEESVLEPRARESDGRPSLAVLPCANRSADPADAYLSLALHDEILLKLQRISSLLSIARTSVLQFAESPQSAIGIASELDVGFIGGCSVQKYGDRIRLIFNLLDGRTGEQIWAEDYDRTLTSDNLFDIQTDVAQQVAREVGALLTSDERARIAFRPTESLQAYRLYLLGRSYSGQLTEAGFERATGTFEQALAIDNGFARAYAGIADAWSSLTMGWGRPPVEVFPRVRQAAEMALRLDPSLPEGHASLGMVLLLFDWDLDGADAAFRRALDLDPNYAVAHHWLGICLMSRARYEEALAEIQRALALDPLSLPVNLNVGYILYVAGNYRGAVDHYDSALTVFPNQPLLRAFRGAAQAQLGNLPEAISDLERAVELAGNDNLVALPYLGYAYGLAGREADARAILGRLHDLDRERFVNPDYFSIVHLGLGEPDEALEWLYEARAARTDWAVFLTVDPVARPLQQDPRFLELVHGAQEEAFR